MLLKFPIILSSNSFFLYLLFSKLFPEMKAGIGNLTCIFCYKLRYNCYIWLTSIQNRHINDRDTLIEQLSALHIYFPHTWSLDSLLDLLLTCIPFLSSQSELYMSCYLLIPILSNFFYSQKFPNILELFFMLWGSYYSRNYSSIMCSSLVTYPNQTTNSQNHVH